jgi:4-hydroxy-4-methyl-2-oxoglutarate aldolase
VSSVDEKWLPQLRVGTIQRPPAALIERAGELGTSLLTDAMRRTGAMGAELTALTPGRRFAGPALTVESMVGDNLAAHYALKLAQPGDVLVIAGGGYTRTSVWGGLTQRVAELAGVAGVVVDGACRDAKEIAASGVPLYARAVSPLGPHKGWGGTLLMPIACAGVPVAPGDAVVADEDGIAVVPAAQLAAVVEGAERAADAETDWFRRAEQGEIPYDFLGFRASITDDDS